VYIGAKGQHPAVPVAQLSGDLSGRVAPGGHDRGEPMPQLMRPVARLYWLFTGRRLPGIMGRVFPPPRVLVAVLRPTPPADILALTPNPRPPKGWPEDMPWWFRGWGRLGAALDWDLRGAIGPVVSRQAPSPHGVGPGEMTPPSAER
jgi:hypothetical protein